MAVEGRGGKGGYFKWVCLAVMLVSVGALAKTVASQQSQIKELESDEKHFHEKLAKDTKRVFLRQAAHKPVLSDRVSHETRQDESIHDKILR